MYRVVAVNPLVAVFEEKKKIIETLESMLDDKSIHRARVDHHSKRQPIPVCIVIPHGLG